MAAAVTLLAGCAAPGSPSPQLTFANYEPVSLNVQTVAVTEAYINPNDPDNIASQFVLPPSEAVKRYAANRFKESSRADGEFAIAIEDARVHMRQIKQDSKVLQWSGVGQEDEYRVMLQLKVTSQPSGFKGRQTTTVKMDRTLVMPSSVTLSEREMRQTQFLEKMIADVDARINEALDQTPAIRQ
jgi:hypothetical protein